MQVIVKKGDKTFSHTQDCCKVPTAIVNAISRASDGSFQETWGEVANRLGLAKDSKNPHKEVSFGGVSRDHHLFQAMCKTIAQVKENTQTPFSFFLNINNFKANSYALFLLFQKAYQQIVHVICKALAILKSYLTVKEEQFDISRFVNLNDHKSKDRYAKKGVLFTPSIDLDKGRSINHYNQGCSIKDWNVPAEKLKRTDFKIFSTGDAFSLLGSEVEVNGANIVIHVGVEHPNYSPLVLLQEALQLCRCTYEHGAKKITVALPEQFHPTLHPSDFNFLLMDLFKVSGATKVYFYDKTFKGVLDESNSKALIPFSLAPHADPETYKLSKVDLLAYLNVSPAPQTLDEQVMHFTRKSNLKRLGAKLHPGLEQAYEKRSQAEIKIPEINNPPHILLCCSANQPLAEKIAANLRLGGEVVQLYSIEGKGEHASIPKEVAICGAQVTLVQATRPNPDKLPEAQEYQINGASSYFFEAAMIARQAQLRGAAKINLINPYQFSARSDKAENNPKGKTGAYVQHNGLLLEAAGVNHVITAECHDAHTMSGSYTGKNIRGSAINALSVIAAKIANEWLASSQQGQLRLVTPDAGATKRTKELTQQLQAILGKKLCESRILGEKQRDSHQDDSALINSLNSGTVGINAEDKYLITDDETATGNTLCQAIANLKKNGAKDIAVIVIHNNMPLDWLLRQLCLARFLYLGVNDLHFSDTQEMGSMAKSYNDLIQTYSLLAQLPEQEVENQIRAWFKKNISEEFADKTEEHTKQQFEEFKAAFGQISAKVRVHSLASEFANQVKTASYVADPVISEVKTAKAYSATNGSLLFFPAQRKNVESKKEQPENERVLACR